MGRDDLYQHRYYLSVLILCRCMVSYGFFPPALILFRIWRVDRLNAGLISQSATTRSAKHGPYHNAKRIIIESGLLYTTVATITASVYISGSNAFAPLTAIVRGYSKILLFRI